MPPSQLKRLKESLRAEGIVGPQKSKKAKKQGRANGSIADTRAQRATALQGIREKFNPFEVQPSASGRQKFQVTNNRTLAGQPRNEVKARPGVSKGYGEEIRRKTLLPERQQRNRAGGIRDRRFGENDPTMAPEDRILERFTKEKQRSFGKTAMFDLEDDEEEGALTHFGKSLSFDTDKPVDDYEDEDALSLTGGSEAEDGSNPLKRRRLLDSTQPDAEGYEPEDGQPERKKTKAEVMSEVIAKSKYHKYERQQAKEDDEDVREELDKELPDLLALMRGNSTRSQPPTPANDVSMNPERAAMLEARDKAKANKDYDLRLREMAMDKRSQPTERTKTEQEKADEEADRLRELEAQRIRRMRGEDSGDEDQPDRKKGDDFEEGSDEEDGFGLGSGITSRPSQTALGVEDEDDFLLEDDLIANDSDVDISGSGEESENDLSEDGSDDSNNPDPETNGDDAAAKGSRNINGQTNGIAYTYPCPQNLEEFLDIIRGVLTEAIPVVIQRIRALYHPKLHPDNKLKLGTFGAVLVDHLANVSEADSKVSFQVTEQIMRHVHSLAKTHPEEIGRTFRSHLKDIHDKRALSLSPGDLMILTAIGSVFPTSDHFHQVVTPANLVMARYLSQARPNALSDLLTGTYVGTLCLQYQRTSKRYIPELISYTLNALCQLAPYPMKIMPGSFPYHNTSTSLRIEGKGVVETRQLRFSDILQRETLDPESPTVKVALLQTHVALLDSMVDTWIGKSAFVEIFGPAQVVLEHLASSTSRKRLPKAAEETILRTSRKLQRTLKLAEDSRQPLRLQQHKPLAIKSSIPKFEESYNLDKHYDPDKERAASSKLRAEHKRERKGALRELRKDANFIARESLKEKKERDAEYEKKYKRLVAEIQGEEGHEAKVYEREKRLRKAKKR